MSIGSRPVPYYLSDLDCLPRNDPLRAAHLARIAIQKRIEARITAAVADHSYAVLVRRADMEA